MVQEIQTTWKCSKHLIEMGEDAMEMFEGGVSGDSQAGASPYAANANKLSGLFNNGHFGVQEAKWNGAPQRNASRGFGLGNLQNETLRIARNKKILRGKHKTPYQVFITDSDGQEHEIAFKFWEELAQSPSMVQEHVISHMPRKSRQLLKEIFWELWNFESGETRYYGMYKMLDDAPNLRSGIGSVGGGSG